MVTDNNTRYRAAQEHCLNNESSTSVEQEARRLHTLGLNVIPIRRGTKKTFGQWGRLNSTRLHPALFHSIFARPSLPVSLAVVAGTISRNLFVLDADTPEAYQMLASVLETAGLRTWQRSSWRGGAILDVFRGGRSTQCHVRWLSNLGAQSLHSRPTLDLRANRRDHALGRSSMPS